MAFWLRVWALFMGGMGGDLFTDFYCIRANDRRWRFSNGFHETGSRRLVFAGSSKTRAQLEPMAPYRFSWMNVCKWKYCACACTAAYASKNTKQTNVKRAKSLYCVVFNHSPLQISWRNMCRTNAQFPRLQQTPIALALFHVGCFMCVHLEW